MELFLSKVEISRGCWNWKGGLFPEGYGHYQYNGKSWKAHRISYLFFKGELDPNLTIDHLCKNPTCVNPEHLEQVTMKENILRGSSPPACFLAHRVIPS